MARKVKQVRHTQLATHILTAFHKRRATLRPKGLNKSTPDSLGIPSGRPPISRTPSAR